MILLLLYSAMFDERNYKGRDSRSNYGNTQEEKDKNTSLMTLYFKDRELWRLFYV